MLKKIKMEKKFYSDRTGWAAVSSLPGGEDLSTGKILFPDGFFW